MPTDPALSEHLAAAVEGLALHGQAAPRLMSGAGHDAAVMAALTPMTMLFVRTPRGLSHHPDEAVNPEDVAIALAAIDGFLDRLALALTDQLAADAQATAPHGG